MTPNDENRSEDLRCHAGTSTRAVLEFTFDGEPVRALEGETIAAALYAANKRVLRHTKRHGLPRGVFCNMGVCFDCLVQIDGRPNQRACRELVAADLRVESQGGFGAWGPKP